MYCNRGKHNLQTFLSVHRIIINIPIQPYPAHRSIPTRFDGTDRKFFSFHFKPYIFGIRCPQSLIRNFHRCRRHGSAQTDLTEIVFSIQRDNGCPMIKQILRRLRQTKHNSAQAGACVKSHRAKNHTEKSVRLKAVTAPPLYDKFVI